MGERAPKNVSLEDFGTDGWERRRMSEVGGVDLEFVFTCPPSPSERPSGPGQEERMNERVECKTFLRNVES